MAKQFKSPSVFSRFPVTFSDITIRVRETKAPSVRREIYSEPLLLLWVRIKAWHPPIAQAEQHSHLPAPTARGSWKWFYDFVAVLNWNSWRVLIAGSLLSRAMMPRHSLVYCSGFSRFGVGDFHRVIAGSVLMCTLGEFSAEPPAPPAIYLFD